MNGMGTDIYFYLKDKEEDKDNDTNTNEISSHIHVLLHFVKSPCPKSVNPFSTLFPADIQHNCPILFCICRTYFPP